MALTNRLSRNHGAHITIWPTNKIRILAMIGTNKTRPFSTWGYYSYTDKHKRMGQTLPRVPRNSLVLIISPSILEVNTRTFTISHVYWFVVVVKKTILKHMKVNGKDYPIYYGK